MPMTRDTTSRASAAAECVARRRANSPRATTGCFLDSYIGLSPAAVDHRLDPVAVGIEDEGCIVIRRVLRPQPRWAVVAAAAGERCAMECVYCFAARGGEREVESRARNRDLVSAHLDRELVSAARKPVADCGRVSPNPDAAQRGERCVVKRSGTGEVGDCEGNVVQHG